MLEAQIADLILAVTHGLSTVATPDPRHLKTQDKSHSQHRPERLNHLVANGPAQFY
jgi:hypothetical protein